MSVILGRLSGAFLLNCELFALTLLFALPLGLVVAFGSMSRCKVLSGAVKTFGGRSLLARACLKNAFCKMCVTICGRFRLNEGGVAGYVN